MTLPNRPRRAESLDVAGVLGAAVAHELRNLLASASSSIFLAKRDIDKRTRLVAHLDAAEAEVQRSQDVIERVLRLVRGEPIHREACPIADVVAAALRNVQGSPVRIDVDVEPSDLVVSCEPLLVERLITNLILNAADALSNRSSGSVAVRVRPDERGFVLEVEDNGPGFDPAVMQRLFEPGVTTKSTGTGLGLLLCRAIVRAHGGDMIVTRAPSGGALVRCEFVQEDASE
ncbi:MAG: HAMP domain-containing histidine kinase [Polyangiaceae bacterium]|nr:HAMP domain-containing histidine kinase [Polyangiaceae bacterium]